MAENSSFRKHARRWLVAASILGVAGVGASYLIWKSGDSVAELSNEPSGRYEGPGFAVLLPGTPTEEIIRNEGDFGTVEIHHLVLEPEGNEPSYRVEYFEYPLGPLEMVMVFSQGGLEVLPVASGRGLAAELQAEVLSETPLSMGVYPGNEVTIDGPDGHTTIARIYLVKHRLYRLIVTTPSAETFQKEIQEFFNSFELLETSAS